MPSQGVAVSVEPTRRIRRAACLLVPGVALALLVPYYVTDQTITLGFDDLAEGSHYSLGGVDLELTYFGISAKCGAAASVTVRCVGAPWAASFRVTYHDGWTQDVDFLFGGSACTPGEPSDLSVGHTWAEIHFHHVCGDRFLTVTRT